MRISLEAFAIRRGADRERAGVALLVAGGWFAPLVTFLGAGFVGPTSFLVGIIIIVLGFVLCLTGDDETRSRSILIGIGASVAVGAATIAFRVFPFGPVILLAPPILVVAVLLFAVRSPGSSRRSTSLVAAGGGVLLITVAALFAAFEGLVWYVEAFLPDAGVQETYGYLRPDELQSVVQGATIWTIASAGVLAGFVVWSCFVAIRRKGGARRVGAVALGCAATVLVGMNFGSFSVGWNLTDYLPQPDDYIGGVVRHFAVSVYLAAGSILAFWPGGGDTTERGDGVSESVDTDLEDAR